MKLDDEISLLLWVFKEGHAFTNNFLGLALAV